MPKGAGRSGLPDILARAEDRVAGVVHDDVERPIDLHSIRNDGLDLGAVDIESDPCAA